MKQFFKTVFASTLGVLVALGIVTMGSVFFIIGVAASADGSSVFRAHGRKWQPNGCVGCDQSDPPCKGK